MTTKPQPIDPQPGPFIFGLVLGAAIVATAWAVFRPADPPYDGQRHIELTTPAGERCRLSGPGRFDVLEAYAPAPTHGDRPR